MKVTRENLDKLLAGFCAEGDNLLAATGDDLRAAYNSTDRPGMIQYAAFKIAQAVGLDSVVSKIAFFGEPSLLGFASAGVYQKMADAFRVEYPYDRVAGWMECIPERIEL